MKKKLFIDSQKYISVFKAIELIAKHTQDDVKTVIKYLSSVGVEAHLDSYIKTESDAYYPFDNYFSGAYQITSEIIATLFNIKNLKNDYELNSFNYPELCKYEDYYWLKTDFFTCPIIQELNIQEDNLSIEFITNNTTPLFYLNDIFNVIEAACLLSGDDPIYMSISLNDTNFEQNHPLFNEALNFINSAIMAKKLSSPITSRDLKIYLQSKGRVIRGFNDAIMEINNFNDFDKSYLDYRPEPYTPDYQFWNDIEQYRIDELESQLVNITNQLNLKKIEELKELLGKSEEESIVLAIDLKATENRYNKLQQENEKLKTELAQAQARIGKLEQSNLNENIGLSDVSRSLLLGLARRNQLAQDRQGMARIIALNLWENDASILIGDMANKVYAIMVDYCREDLPQTPETIKNWIRPVATEEAQKKGRPKSNS